MILRLFIIATLLPTFAWSLSCMEPTFLEINKLNEDLVEVKEFLKQGPCVITEEAVNCQKEPYRIDTLSHKRMLNQLKDAYQQSTYAGVITPKKVVPNLSECQNLCPELTPDPNSPEGANPQSICSADIICPIDQTQALEVKVDLDFKNNLNTQLTIPFTPNIWGSPSSRTVIFFSKYEPTTLNQLQITFDLCGTETSYLGLPGRFILQKETIYQVGQPGLSIPLSLFLNEVTPKETSPVKTQNPSVSLLDPNEFYSVYNAKGNLIFSGKGRIVHTFLTQTPQASQFKVLPQKSHF